MRLTRRGVILGLAGLGLARGARAEGPPVLVFAAASLKNALDEALQSWSRRTGKAVRASYAASNTLAKQIEAGAPADLFFTADLDWMGYVAARNLIRPGTRVELLGNSLVLVAPRDSTVSVALAPGLDLRAALGSGRLAMGHVEAVPAGKYGKAALTHLGAWEGVKDRVAQAESVRAALLLVSRGEAPLGIVYATDAVADAGVRVVATFPADSHPPIVYPLAQVAASTHPDAPALLADLRGPEARAAFERQGFTLLASPAGRS
ncbi:molybdate ABC transporter substrate-binding protein [Methylobacterium sp. CB376]|uniref:molybdate ABC transporter substrate-binding protein n=1 Tax=Methylobacterium sp. CB376 TaxID=3138063 RepID=UPI0024B1C62C|nr:molybdate ABC transporter substrate-binding protein [Methylobacterium nodulans]WFT81945.1 molybdate ABC transporter substrate-binding protein [Methylobacterium nodulans]